jgi:hypothetical protein
LYGQGEGARILLLRVVEFRSCCGLLLAFWGETELVEFTRGVVLVVVHFEGFDFFGHKVLIFEGRCHGQGGG